MAMAHFRSGQRAMAVPVRTEVRPISSGFAFGTSALAALPAHSRSVAAASVWNISMFDQAHHPVCFPRSVIGM